MYCSFEDSRAKLCDKTTPINYAGDALVDLDECYDSCEVDPNCRYFAFHPEDGGLCQGFDSCATYKNSTNTNTLVYMMDGKPGVREECEGGKWE